MVYDRDFEVPLAAAQVSIAETGDKITTTDEGNFLFNQVPSGIYTLVFSKDGYTRQVQANVVVSPGKMTDVEASLSGEFTEMEEFVVQDLQIGGTEAGLLMLRVESPALLDSIGSEWLSQAGVSDAASALKLISGATVQDGKFAVVRGLPDRYVNSQMNGVRLPTADPDKRAVQLDQFPTEVIDSVQVSKAFTPDQQGDASGGAVNVVLKGIPEENVFKFKTGAEYNTQVTGRSDFLTYKGGGGNFWGIDDDRKDIPQNDNFTGPLNVSEDNGPINYGMSITAGGKRELKNGINVGGLLSSYYKRDSSFFDDGIDDSLWIDDEDPRRGLTPQYGNPDGPPPDDPIPPIGEDFKTALFDITEGSKEVQWGVLSGVGAETENHSLNLVFMHTQVTEDKAILAEDTRGKEYYFPDYERNNPKDLGNLPDNQNAAPYLRSETLVYTERTTDTLQLHAEHILPLPEIELEDFFTIFPPEIDWTFALSSSDLDEPDKRQFGSVWKADSFDEEESGPGFDVIIPSRYEPFTQAANILLGNLSRTWREISEESDQFFLDWKFPFEQWSGDAGYLKLGMFYDQVDRTFDQDSFGNFRLTGDDPIPVYEGSWDDDSYSEVFPNLGGPVTKDGPPFVDVDYDGEQDISAWYYMVDFPLCSFLKFIGGVRYESTKIEVINDPEEDAKWVTTDENGNRLYIDLLPGDADVSLDQDDMLPSVGFVLTPISQIKLQGTYSETVARPTFKELTPIQQQDFLGDDIFIGNPALQISAVQNYDLRIDYTPYKGGLLSFSWFHKKIEDPIEYVQDLVNAFSFITPVNYPEGELKGFEIETRHHLGHFWDPMEGLSIGGNVTVIDSEVTLPERERENIASAGVKTTTRDMVNAPEHLYNIHLTYDYEPFDTQIGIFYTVKGDALVVGAGNRNGKYVPDIYATEFNELNLSVSKKIGDHFKLSFKAKNLTNPVIEEVYRPPRHLGDEEVRTSYTRGIDFSFDLSGTW
ncbi:MAG: TonB-dependent receptor [Candidatus Brocadiaceae bacterium]|nr:TonB-dependent receptor [Candidatus Brocadiaceae bacterium]